MVGHISRDIRGKMMMVDISGLDRYEVGAALANASLPRPNVNIREIRTVTPEDIEETLEATGSYVGTVGGKYIAVDLPEGCTEFDATRYDEHNHLRLGRTSVTAQKVIDKLCRHGYTD
jgi:hypothetical protein